MRPSDPKKQPNILIAGAGSIGKRHARNARSLGANVSIFDIDQLALKSFCQDTGCNPIADLDRALIQEQFDAALICTPNHLHISTAQKVADAGLDLFIEKPLSHTNIGVAHLIETIARKSLIAMGGFNLRFEPGLQYLKKTIDPTRVAFAHIESGSHMPTWRQGVDYRKTYSANNSMGGGIILDDVHELDYACWLFDYPDKVSCNFGKFSNFEIDVEDTAEFLFAYPDKLVTIHADYLQKRYTRKCRICLRNGDTIEWEFGKYVKEYTNGNEKTYSYQDSFDTNNLYLWEMQAFFHHITERTQPESDINNAARILQIALRVKQQHTVEQQ